ncbi:unnamed protein product [Somion occarium]|uniref:FAD-binding domain-containing protein n=2 Tax=Somion occarium TaxID=3059160 RepID=A0ABP1E360_9APHY
MAVALSKYSDIQVDVYEAAGQFSEVGAGIGMWPRTWNIMESLGLTEDLAKIAVISPTDIPKVAFTLRKGDEPIGHTFHQLITPGMITFHRPDFQAVLLLHLSSTSCRTHTAKRLKTYLYGQGSASKSESSLLPIHLHFQDGTTATCDLLIGADGVRSAVRATMLRDLATKAQSEGHTQEAQEALAGVDPVWSGLSMYRTIFPSQTLSQQLPGHRVLHDPMIYVGRNTQITAYPISRGTGINFAATRSHWEQENTLFEGPWVQDVSRDELLHAFDRWEPEVVALFQSIEGLNRWAMHTVRPLRSYVSERVALIGDSAHAMLPYQGVGAGQAIEDAFLLATLLGHSVTTPATLSRALKVYDAVRRPFSQHVLETSRENGQLFTLNYPGLTFGTPQENRDAKKLQKLQDLCNRVRKNWEWCWLTTLDADLERAVKMLENGSQ